MSTSHEQKTTANRFFSTNIASDSYGYLTMDWREELKYSLLRYLSLVSFIHYTNANMNLQQL